MTPNAPSRLRSAVTAGMLSCALFAAGCTSTPTDPRDPWEPMNRVFYTFNRAVDTTIVTPAAEVYRWALPQFVRTGFNNFVENFRDLWRFVNGLLQGDPGRAFDYFARVFFNTTLGLGGVLDVATTDMGIKGGANDLGMTFAKWGISDGPFLVIPLFGPATVRDGIGYGIETWFDPLQWTLKATNAGWKAEWGMFITRYINARARLLDTEQLISEALDPYAFQRDSYFQFRRSLMEPHGYTPRGEGEGADPEPNKAEDASLTPSSAAPTNTTDAAPEEAPEPHRTSAVDIEESAIPAI